MDTATSIPLDPEDALASARALRVLADRIEAGGVAAAVEAGWTWAEVGSPSIEAEHLLLAYASGPWASVIDRRTVLAALQEDFEASLRAAGVSEETIASAPPAKPTRKPRFGASSKSALECAYRAAKERGDRHIEARHVALGVLAAKRGTVPRALSAAGIDGEGLRERI